MLFSEKIQNIKVAVQEQFGDISMLDQLFDSTLFEGLESQSKQRKCFVTSLGFILLVSVKLGERIVNKKVLKISIQHNINQPTSFCRR